MEKSAQKKKERNKSIKLLVARWIIKEKNRKKICLKNK
jgi:hypothetical protein